MQKNINVNLFLMNAKKKPRTNMLLIDYLVFNANFSSISAILWHNMLLIDLLVFNANFSSISVILWHNMLLKE
jgi:hypothetical protein